MSEKNPPDSQRREPPPAEPLTSDVTPFPEDAEAAAQMEDLLRRLLEK